MNIIVLFAFVLCSCAAVVRHKEYTVNNSSNDVNVSSSFPSESPTLSSNHNCLSFYLLGDWGKGGTTGSYGGKKVLGKDKTYYQVAVAKSMNNYAMDVINRPSFVVALGDNFYSNGVSSSTDALWSYLWKDVYLQEYDSLNIPWYPVFGNHDYGGSTVAQIQRYHDHTDDDIWMFESYYYMKKFDMPGGGSVVILFIDTTTLAPSENKCCNEKGGISVATQQERIEQQVQFIENKLNELTESRPTWLFVSGHYPVYSAGDHGDITELGLYLLPLLERFEVDAYFCGHDHISEHLYANGTHYFVAGAGSMTDTLKMTSKAQLLWSGTGYSAFAVVNVSVEAYTVQFVDTSNIQSYSHTVMARGTRPPTISPTFMPTLDYTDMPTSLPSWLPSQSDVAEELTTSDPSGPSSHRDDPPTLLESIGRLFREGTNNTVVVVSGSILLSSSFMLLLYTVYYKYQRNDSSVSEMDSTMAQASSKSRYEMVHRRATKGSEDRGGDEGDDYDEEMGNDSANNASNGQSYQFGRVRSESDSSYHPRNPQRYVDMDALRSDLALDRAVFRTDVVDPHIVPPPSPPLFVRGANDTRPSELSDLSASASLASPEEGYRSMMGDNSGGISSGTVTGESFNTVSNARVKQFESALRLKLFDVIATTISSEDIRNSTSDGRIFQRTDGTTAAVHSSHKRGVTMQL